jgi:predicted aconitase with swiveling domain
MIAEAARRATLRGTGLVAGVVRGMARTCRDAVSVARIDPETGVLHEPGHALDGCCLAGGILVFPVGKGSSGGSYILMNLAAKKIGPVAIVMDVADAVVIAGAVLAGIPLVTGVGAEALARIHDGDRLRVDGAAGLVCIL